MYRQILTIARGLEVALSWAIAALVILILAIVTGQFLDRHVIDLPWDAPDQLARICIVWLTFLGTALALSEGAAIRIDIIDHVLPRWLHTWRDALFDCILLALLIVIAVKGWAVVKIGASQILLGTPFTADLPYAGLFVGLLLAAFFVAIRIIRRIAGHVASEVEKP